MDDSKIVDLFCQRSEQAIDECRHAYHGLLLHLAQNITGSFQDAEECVSDTYWKLWSSIPPAHPASLRAYALRILRNTAIDRRRSTARQDGQVSLDAIEEELGVCLAASSEAPDTLALRDILERFLSGQPKENRILFLRRYFQCEPLERLAAQSGLSQNAVKMRLMRMRRSLAAELGKEYGYETP